jgi:Lipase (class 3)
LPPENATARLMLTLAAISYRGVNLIAPEAHKRARLRQLMDECMAKFSMVAGKWKIVWGPASFSAVSPGLDDALMYVAQSSEKPSSFAIAIRGTNPISVSDWVFGDLMVTHQVPWAYGNQQAMQGAEVSASTMIGLGILQHLTWSDAQAAAPPAPFNPRDLLQARLTSETASTVIQTLGLNVRELVAERFNPLKLLRKHADAALISNGKSVKEFLADQISKVPASEIFVTGHSKGGALSSTVALWLKDTQGPQATASEQWDPQSKATINCYSFAGPTAGNEAFAKHSDDTLKDKCVRVWNNLDVVPKAFVPDAMRETSKLYELSSSDKKFLDPLIEKVAAGVKDLHYRQICGEGMRLDCALIPKLPFPLQMIHQHLDAYLQQFGLDDEMTALSLLAPVLP